MDERFRCAYEKAAEVLKAIQYDKKKMIPTADLMEAVKRILDVRISFSEFDFAKLKSASGKNEGTYANYGAAMSVGTRDGQRYAHILLNSRETLAMQRFSLIHELGHLMIQADFPEGEFRVSTHIDMDITSIPDEFLNNKDYSFLVEEQKANVFALLVLLPYDSLVVTMKEKDSIDDIAKFYGVERDAVISRLMLEMKT